MDNTLLNILRDAKKLISNKNNWCQHAGALDKNGECVYSLNEEAVKFCVLGAINRACNKHIPTINSQYNSIVSKLLQYLNKFSYRLYKKPYVIEVNDYSSHEDVIKVLTEALKEKEKENNNEE